MDKPPRLIETHRRPEVASYDYWDEKARFAQQALTVATHRRSLSSMRNPDQLKLGENDERSTTDIDTRNTK